MGLAPDSRLQLGRIAGLAPFLLVHRPFGHGQPLVPEPLELLHIFPIQVGEARPGLQVVPELVAQGDGQLLQPDLLGLPGEEAAEGAVVEDDLGAQEGIGDVLAQDPHIRGIVGVLPLFPGDLDASRQAFEQGFGDLGGQAVGGLDKAVEGHGPSLPQRSSGAGPGIWLFLFRRPHPSLPDGREAPRGVSCNQRIRCPWLQRGSWRWPPSVAGASGAWSPSIRMWRGLSRSSRATPGATWSTPPTSRSAPAPRATRRWSNSPMMPG